MRRFLYVVALPLAVDAILALTLSAGDRAVHRAAPAVVTLTSGPPDQAAPRGGNGRLFLVFFDSNSADLSPRARQIVAAAVRASAERPGTWIDMLGDWDRSAGPAYAASLTLCRARNVRSELLHDGLRSGDIDVVVTGDGAAPTDQMQLVLR